VVDLDNIFYFFSLININPKIQTLFLKAWNLKINFGKLKFFLIPREENKEADRLVNEALEQKILVSR